MVLKGESLVVLQLHQNHVVGDDLFVCARTIFLQRPELHSSTQTSVIKRFCFKQDVILGLCLS